MNAANAIPAAWLRFLTSGPVAAGLDIATTAKKTSNPSSLVVSQREGNMIHERLVVAWKTTDDRVIKAILLCVLTQLASTRRKLRALSIDSSSEKFNARQIKRDFTKFCPVRLIDSGGKVNWKGEDTTFKVLLGNLYSGLYEDALITIPEGQWIIDDRRLVRHESGSFTTDLGPNGEHGDTFDGGKLAYWGLCKAGRAEIAAATISTSPANPAKPRLVAGITNPLARKHGLRLSQQQKPHLNT